MKIKRVLLFIVVALLANCKEEESHTQLKVEIIPNYYEGVNSPKTLTAKFTNIGDTIIGMIKPMDGSFHSWIYPVYNITLRDSKGKEIKQKMRCANIKRSYEETEFLEDYFIEIRPKESYELSMYISNFFKILDNEVHDIEFEYRLNDGEKKGHYDFSSIENRIWEGRTSATIRNIKLSN